MMKTVDELAQEFFEWEKQERNFYTFTTVNLVAVIHVGEIYWTEINDGVKAYVTKVEDEGIFYCFEDGKIDEYKGEQIYPKPLRLTSDVMDLKWKRVHQ